MTWLPCLLVCVWAADGSPSVRVSPPAPRSLVDGVELRWSGLGNASLLATLSRAASGEASCSSRVEASAGVVRFPCHCVGGAGRLRLALSEEGNGSAALWETEVEASWPELVSIAAPPRQATLNGSVLIAFDVKAVFCRTLSNDIRLALQIEYKGPSQDQTQEYKEFRAGQSSAMRVEWNPAYALQMKSDSLLPCPSGRLSISFERPKCGVPGDRVRLFVIHRRPGRARHSTPTLVYQKEARIDPDRHGVSFSCGSNFDIHNPGYCFKFVSVLPGGLVVERATTCVATEPRGHLPLSGSWSSWGAWGECSATCGLGIHHRVRFCDSPAPLYGGSPCAGAALKTRVCDLGPCPNETSYSAQLVGNSGCGCGCELRKPGVVVITEGLCSKPSTWLIRANPNQRIAVRLVSSSLGSSSVMRIRDGAGASSPLLMLLPGSEKRLRDAVTSRGPIVRIEHARTNRILPRERRSAPWEGAVISLRFIDGDGVEIEDAVHNVTLDLVMITILLVSVLVAVLALSLSGYALWWYTRRKMTSTCALLASQSLHSSASRPSSTDEALRVRVATTGRVRQLLSPGQLAESAGRCGETVEVRAELESQPLLRPGRPPSEAQRAKHLSRILEQPDEGLRDSVATDSTRLSACSQASPRSPDEPTPRPTPSVLKRSIGIQLSSPALPLRRYQSVESRISSTPSARLARPGSPSSFVGTEQDFEYDYYDPALPGSFLAPTDWLGDLSSEIDIDQIIGDSELMRTPTHKGGSSDLDSSSDASDKATQAVATPNAAVPALGVNFRGPSLFVSRPPFGTRKNPDSTAPSADDNRNQLT